MPLEAATIGVLERMTFDGNKAYLNDDLRYNRPFYLRINEILTRLRGKWKGGKVSAHLFPYEPEALIKAVIKTGEMPPDNPTAYYATPKKVVDFILDELHDDIKWKIGFEGAEYSPKARILEPSAGTGAIAKEILKRNPNADLTCIELLDLNCQLLKDMGVSVLQQDFLTHKPEEPYDVIIMNAPFSVKGDKLAYMTHTHHAWSMLARPNGVLVTVTPPGWTYRSDKRSKAFRRLVSDYASDVVDYPAGTFKESGTTIPTKVISLHPFCGRHARTEYNGYSSFNSWYAMLWIDSIREKHKEYYKMCMSLGKKIDTSLDLFGKARPSLRKITDAFFLSAQQEMWRGEGSADRIFLDEKDLEHLAKHSLIEYQESTE